MIILKFVCIAIVFLLVLWKLEEIYEVLHGLKIKLIKAYNQMSTKQGPLEEWEHLVFDEDHSWCYRENLIAHACGGNVRLNYTNSKEALLQALFDGFRVIEVDVRLTQEGELVCAHDFPLGMTMTRKQFLANKVDNRYSSMDIRECFRTVGDRKVTYIIDTKVGEELPIVVEQLEMICDALGVSKEQVVVQIGTENELSYVKEFPVLYNLGFTQDYERVVAFCLIHNIRYVSISGTDIRKDSGWTVLLQHNIKIFVHTVNSLIEYEELRGLGIQGVFTDYLIPADLNMVN